MSRTCKFTTTTKLPSGASRDVVVNFLHNHKTMIELNPIVIKHTKINPPTTAPSSETSTDYTWYTITDKVQYLPGGIYSGKVDYNACFHDLPDGLATHVYAPLGLDIQGRWQVVTGGACHGTRAVEVEDDGMNECDVDMEVPDDGRLYLRETVKMKCNFLLTNFVKGNMKKSHGTLVERLVEATEMNSFLHPPGSPTVAR